MFIAVNILRFQKLIEGKNTVVRHAEMQQISEDIKAEKTRNRNFWFVTS
jgi:hypothetical protein